MDFLPQRGRIRFVLVSPSHPGNIGSAARAIKTMGFNRLYVVSPRHPEYRTDLDAIAFSTHAVDVLQNSVCTETLLEALKDVSFACALSGYDREFRTSFGRPADFLRNGQGPFRRKPAGRRSPLYSERKGAVSQTKK